MYIYIYDVCIYIYTTSRKLKVIRFLQPKSGKKVDIDINFFSSIKSASHQSPVAIRIMRLRIILENKLLLISINFTPKTSHSCLKKLYTRFSRISFIPPPEKMNEWNQKIKADHLPTHHFSGVYVAVSLGGRGEYQEYHLQFLCLSSTLHVLSC